MNTRSPHTTGLEWPTPATGVFHTTPFPVVASHLVGSGWLSEMREPEGSRKRGHFCAHDDAAGVTKIGTSSTDVRYDERMMFPFAHQTGYRAEKSRNSAEVSLRVSAFACPSRRIPAAWRPAPPCARR